MKNTTKAKAQWCKALKKSLYRLYNINAIIEYDTIYGYVVSIFNGNCEKLTFTSEASFSHEAICDFMQ